MRARRVAFIAVVAMLATACGGGGGTATDVDGLPETTAGSLAVEHPVDFVGAGGTRLAGTFRLPALPADGKPVPAALIVAGSGAIDRNGVVIPDTVDRSADRLALDVNPSHPGTPDLLYADVARLLSEAGVASLRYDKRGSGASRLPAGRALTVEDLIADARAGVEFLAHRKEVDPTQIAVVGHDQGGPFALRLAAVGSPPVAAVVAISTPARTLADVIGDDLVQARGQAGTDLSSQLHATATALVGGASVPSPDSLAPELRPLFPPGDEAYLRGAFALDPATEAAAVRQPVLVVRGDDDTTITASDVDRLSAALPTAPEVMSGAGDHNLAVARRRDLALVTRVSSWVGNRLGARP